MTSLSSVLPFGKYEGLKVSDVMRIKAESDARSATGRPFTYNEISCKMEWEKAQ